jgi:outer membrane lipoprotein carrier protein
MVQEKFWLMRLLSKSVVMCLITCTAVFSDEAFCSEQAGPETRLVHILDNLQTLHAEFTHQAALSETQTGEIWLRKPGLFRVETGAPLSQTIVSDGVSMWTHDRDLEQVIISPLNTRVDEMPILLFSGEPEAISQNYIIESFESEQIQHFVLTPVDNTNLITKLMLSFQENLPVSISVENAMQKRTTIKLSNVSELVDGTKSMFTLQVPKFADVFDDRPD